MNPEFENVPIILQLILILSAFTLTGIVGYLLLYVTCYPMFRCCIRKIKKPHLFCKGDIICKQFQSPPGVRFYSHLYKIVNIKYDWFWSDGDLDVYILLDKITGEIKRWNCKLIEIEYRLIDENGFQRLCRKK